MVTLPSIPEVTASPKTCSCGARLPPHDMALWLQIRCGPWEMPMHNRARLAALALLAIAAGAHAEAPHPPDGPTICDAGAWVNGAQTAPVPVHEAASADSPVIGHLPIGDDTRDYSVTFRITGTRDGWLHIDSISDTMNTDAGYPPRPLPARDGWVRAGAAAFGIQSAYGHVMPSAASTRLLDLGQGNWLTELGRIEALLACEGEWMLLDVTLLRRRLPTGGLQEIAPARHRAWFRGHCPIQETSCDRRSVDQ